MLSKKENEIVKGFNWTINELLKSGKGHYYVTSSSNWKRGACLFDLISKVRKYDIDMVKSRGLAGTTCSIYFVPLAEAEHYEINNYMPIVEGCIYLGKVDYSKAVERADKRSK